MKRASIQGSVPLWLCWDVTPAMGGALVPGASPGMCGPHGRAEPGRDESVSDTVSCPGPTRPRPASRLILTVPLPPLRAPPGGALGQRARSSGGGDSGCRTQWAGRGGAPDANPRAPFGGLLRPRALRAGARWRGGRSDRCSGLLARTARSSASTRSRSRPASPSPSPRTASHASSRSSRTSTRKVEGALGRCGGRDTAGLRSGLQRRMPLVTASRPRSRDPGVTQPQPLSDPPPHPHLLRPSPNAPPDPPR